MMVTIGARGNKSSGKSSTSISTASISSSADTKLTSKPNSSAMTVIASASKRWLIDTNIPKLIHVEITSLTDTSINDAKSLAEINSVTFKTFASSSSAIKRASSASARPLRFSFLFSAPKLCFADAPCRRAIVALICS